MVRTRFGAFLAPHHPTGEHPTLLMQRDLDLAAHLDRLGFEEFWCGEHHSSGWETIASPEMFLAAAGQLTHRIGLGAGASVVGTPDDMVAAIRRLQEVTGGFGVVLGFAHDWADREATFRSWELFARYVIPEINGYTERFRQSQQYLHDHQSELIAGAGKGRDEQDHGARRRRSGARHDDGATRCRHRADHRADQRAATPAERVPPGRRGARQGERRLRRRPTRARPVSRPSAPPRWG